MDNSNSSKRGLITGIVSIIILVLAIIGITYAYFTTFVVNNNSTNSVSISSGKLEIVYDNGNGNIVAEEIKPDYTLKKEFSVTNTGTEDIDTYSIVLEEITNQFTNYEDITYELSCISSVSGITPVTTGVFPREKSVILTPSISVGETQNYTLKVTYNETNTDQSEDINKTLKAKVNIEDYYGPDGYKKLDLVYNIMNDATKGVNGTLLKNTPDTVPGKEISASNEAVLAKTADDYGDSYYFRGNVTNNYLNFKGMCWRIVRIEGDGSIKIILEHKKKTCENMSSSNIEYPNNLAIPDYPYSIGEGNYGYESTTVLNSNNQRSASFNKATYSAHNYSSNIPNYNSDYDSSMKYVLENWLSNSGIALSKLKNDKWCLGNTTNIYNDSGEELSNKNNYIYNNTGFNYESTIRIKPNVDSKSVSLLCNGANYEYFYSYIGTLTVDEVGFAGGRGKANSSDSNSNYYYYLYLPKGLWGLLSVSGYSKNKYETVYRFGSSGDLGNRAVNYLTSSNELPPIRPVITLVSGTVFFGGNGTKTNPYNVV